MKSFSRFQAARSLAFVTLGVAGTPLLAQISLTTAVDLALHNSPRVKTAESEVLRAQAGLSESKDIYVPSVVASSGIGRTEGYPVGQPSILKIQAQSLIFSFSQLDYIRQARYGLNAASLSLADAREGVAADVALTFVALERDQQRDEALKQQRVYAERSVSVVHDRFDAGKDTAIDLTQAKLSLAQLNLVRLRDLNETDADRAHLARLMGIQPQALTVSDTDYPQPNLPDDTTGITSARLSPNVAAAYANARSKQEQAFGDARYLYRPQVGFGLEYDRFATSLNNYNDYYKVNLPANNAQIGAQISFPLFDRVHSARARESAAAAQSARHDADNLRDVAIDNQIRLFHATAELRQRAEVASLEQQLAQQQLDVLLVQLGAPAEGRGPQMTPRDELNSRIAERDKYVSVLESTFQLRQAEINLLRQDGEVEDWLRRSLRNQIPTTTSPTAPQIDTLTHP